MKGRLDDLVKDYSFPVPVELLTTRVIVRNAEECQAMLALQRSSMIERGVISLLPEVTAMDLPRAGRLRIWVDWHEISPSPNCVRVASAIYYCSTNGSDLKIEMIHYVSLSMPELQPHFAALALTA